MNIYVPDELAEQVKEIDEVNVSAVCQKALRAEVARRKEIEKLDKGMEPVEFAAKESHGTTVRFVGRKLAFTGLPLDTTAYLTKNHRIALADNSSENLDVYDSFADMSQAMGESDHEFINEIAEALGEEYVVELDI
jgi:predicted nucleotidyltransferase